MWLMLRRRRSKGYFKISWQRRASSRLTQTTRRHQQLGKAHEMFMTRSNLRSHLPQTSLQCVIAGHGSQTYGCHMQASSAVCCSHCHDCIQSLEKGELTKVASTYSCISRHAGPSACTLRRISRGRGPVTEMDPRIRYPLPY